MLVFKAVNDYCRIIGEYEGTNIVVLIKSFMTGFVLYINEIEFYEKDKVIPQTNHKNSQNNA